MDNAAVNAAVPATCSTGSRRIEHRPQQRGDQQFEMAFNGYEAANEAALAHLHLRGF